MAYTTIKKPSDYFNTKLYDGTGSVANVTGVGFQPDFTWIKRRNDTRSHFVTDAVRGAGKQLKTNLTGTETSYSGYLNSFISDGFTLGTDGDSNDTGGTYSSWNWLANNTSGSSNTDGSITSTVSANTTSGFSIVSYTGSGANATVGHGLGSEVKFIIIKNRDAGDSWITGHSAIGFTKFTKLDENGASGTSSGFFNNTTPTSSVFSIGNQNDVNASGQNIIAYCFADVKGFSKFGSYTGNGSTDGTFCFTGFKPAFVIVKGSNVSGGWWIKDSIRSGGTNPNGSNPNETQYPAANENTVENKASAFGMDILSNGFKLRATDGFINFQGGEYIYMAFAEEPLVGDNPATAR